MTIMDDLTVWDVISEDEVYGAVQRLIAARPDAETLMEVFTRYEDHLPTTGIEKAADSERMAVIRREADLLTEEIAHSVMRSVERTARDNQEM